VTLCGLILLATLTASCQTTGSGAIDPALVACASFKPVYWSKADTAQTVAQIKENNAAGKALCGWGATK
jgi:hypothetical protein